ncbi:MAG: gamma-glutamyltransferase [Hyphomicrobiaceae bacterium]
MPRPARRLPPARAMIVAPQPEAVEAGARVLAEGGSAVDATLACAFAQGVVDPMMCGIGGLGTIQVYDPASGRHIVINGLSSCPAAATATMWSDAFIRECSDGYGYVVKDFANELGHKAVTVPGILRLFAEAHTAFGKLPWADLFQPAIAIAREGFLVRPHVHAMFTVDETAYGRVSYARKLALTADGRRLYMRADGTVKRLGDRVENPELADTLAVIAREGAEAFYAGPIADRMLSDMAANGGLLTAGDLAAYRPRTSAPLMVPFRKFQVALPDPPAGGIVVGEMLRILERFDLAGLGHNSPEYIKVVAEAMKIAGLDKETHVGDPDFGPIPVDHLLSDAYADQCAQRIRRGERTSLARVGADTKETTHVSCIDRNGMVVSLTHTLGLPSGVIPPGLGFMLNGAMNWYDPRPGRVLSIGPGKRRYSSMTPTIVLDGGKPVATLGAPGGAWITVAVLQVLVNIFEHGMGVQEAVMAPRFSATSDTIDISNRIPRATEAALTGDGYTVKRSYQSYAFAGVHAITAFDGVLEGAADPQRDGYAAGVA